MITVSKGFVKTFKILSNGSFEPIQDQMKIFEEASCFNPCIVHDVDDIYVVAYSDR